MITAQDFLRSTANSQIPIVCCVCEHVHKAAGVSSSAIPPVAVVVAGDEHGGNYRFFCDTDECAPFNRRGWKPKT